MTCFVKLKRQCTAIVECNFALKHFSKSTNLTKVVEILEQMGDQRG